MRSKINIQPWFFDFLDEQVDLLSRQGMMSNDRKKAALKAVVDLALEDAVSVETKGVASRGEQRV